MVALVTMATLDVEEGNDGISQWRVNEVSDLMSVWVEVMSRERTSEQTKLNLSFF